MRLPLRGRVLAIGLGIAALTAPPVAAQTLQIPVASVSATDVFSGPTFTVPTALSGTATLSLAASGITYLQSPAQYGTNAAGVVVVAGSTGVGGTSTLTNAYGTFNFGALLIGNATLGFHQLFATNAANGLGSGTPPTTVSLTNVPLATIFGGGLAAGTVLELRVADINTDDNSGGFRLTQAAAAVVPEPSTDALLVAGLVGVGAVARRRRSAPTV